MLRFLNERRAWVVAALVAFMFVLGLWVWVAPRVTARASDLISDRVGVDAHVDEAHLSLGGVELRGLEMHGRHGGFVVRVYPSGASMWLPISHTKDLPTRSRSYGREPLGARP
jgi:hypothetical protein